MGTNLALSIFEGHLGLTDDFLNSRMLFSRHPTNDWEVGPSPQSVATDQIIANVYVHCKIIRQSQFVAKFEDDINFFHKRNFLFFSSNGSTIKQLETTLIT